MEASSRHQGFIQKTFQNLGVFKIFKKKYVKTLGICKVFAKNDGQLKNIQKPVVFDTFSSKTLKTLGKHSFFNA